MGELGSLLTRAREARGLTIEDAERDTRISRRYLFALEAEQFDVIPAPVYARGFLRSYSQYLGLDPKEALALFPRDEQPSPYHAGDAHQAPAQRGTQQQPATVGGARPTWRRPSREDQAQQQQQPPVPRQPQPAPRQPQQLQPGPPPPPRRSPAPSRQSSLEEGWEPTIGIDIGVPAPARRIKTDAAAQARSMTVLVVAVAAIIAVVVLAFAISRLGGDNGGGGPLGAGTQTITAGPTAPSGTARTPSVTTSEVIPGVMPNVVGLTEAAARAAIVAAGVGESAITPTRQSNPAAKGLVYEQIPRPGTDLEEGDQIIIAVSEGP